MAAFALGLVRILKLPLSDLGLVEKFLFRLTAGFPQAPFPRFGKLTTDSPRRFDNKEGGSCTHTWEERVSGSRRHSQVIHDTGHGDRYPQ